MIHARTSRDIGRRSSGVSSSNRSVWTALLTQQDLLFSDESNETAAASSSSLPYDRWVAGPEAL